MTMLDQTILDLQARPAEFWRPLEDGRIACDLCYRRCEIEPGAAGWCNIRRNEGGQMVLTAHGVLSTVASTMNGYGDSAMIFYKPGRRGISLGGISCTARCSFCVSGNVTWNPERVPWLEKWPDMVPPTWAGRRNIWPPERVIKRAKSQGARHITLLYNEPTLNIEYSLDVARLAKQAGLEVQVLTNGLTTPAAIRTLAPYVAAIHLGIKGSLDPGFYARYMKAAGAVPHVLEAAKTWHECGVKILVSDVIAPKHMLSYDALLEAQERLYAWIAETLGEYTPVAIGTLRIPTMKPGKQENRFLLARGGDLGQIKNYYERIASTLNHVKKRAGLHYITSTVQPGMVNCHNCAAPLVELISPMLECHPCSMFEAHCTLWRHKEHVTPDGRCEACGAQTPVVPMSPEERKKHDAWRKEGPEHPFTIRIPVLSMSKKD